MSVQTASTKPKERRLSVNVTMSVVHKTNRSEDKKLERRVEHLKQKEHQDQVRHCTEVKKLEKELESMQVQVEAAGRTFSKRETELQDVPYLFSKKMAAQQPRAVRQRRHRGDSAAAALNRVAKNVELSGKSRFRSAVMAVCVAKGLGEAASGEAVREQEDRETEEGAPGENTAIEGQNMNRSLSSARSGVKRDRLRRKTHPADRPNTSPGKTLTRRYSALRPPSTADQTGSQSQPRPGMNSARSVGRRNTTGNMSVRSAESPSLTPTVSLPDLVGAARASIVHAAESAKAASVLKRRGSAVSTVTAAERELERRRSSAALRLRDIKADLSKRNVDLQDRIKLFVRTSMPGECTVKSPRRLFAIPVGGEPATTSSEMDD
ncbi:uncharacterized protein LOC110974547 [Acanthaster planci]|uniref:Uncharacterized protein LOC110974547 n=1 Tax=Acanthaster planci TaxID=133434 RepID=A0A8B7XMD6_ACAPL|nr:uncharacterized protein LOC110974547 [Acanthaster planci]